MIMSIKRVVSCFILSRGDDLRVAVFHRVNTMPTFPSHWAACSGSIEEGETPLQTVRRELCEETNLPAASLELQGGLYLDVPVHTLGNGRTTAIIRVYPFAVELPPGHTLALRGSEHDSFQFVTVSELEALHPAVPGLSQAFHHATHARYLATTTTTTTSNTNNSAYCAASVDAVREWCSDTANGSAEMARNAVLLVERESSVDPAKLRLMRPGMVAITNALDRCLSDDKSSPRQVLEALQRDAELAVQYAVKFLQPLIEQHHQRSNHHDSEPDSLFTIATHSRSSTVLAVLQRILHTFQQRGGDIRIVCSKSTPGDEGILMARDLGDGIAECVDDDVLLERIRTNSIDLLLLGCDCLTEKDVVNKIGTAASHKQQRPPRPKSFVVWIAGSSGRISIRHRWKRSSSACRWSCFMQC